MKTSGTLQSIRSIAGSKSADGSQVRFNRFTGKAIVMGSSGSRFGLVSWVRKLYTTSSNKKVQRFLMDGITKERGTEIKDSFCQRRGGALGLRTVRELKELHGSYAEFVRLDKLLSDVSITVGSFQSDPGRFESRVNLERCKELASVPKEERRVYCIAGLKSVNKCRKVDDAALAKFSKDTRESGDSRTQDFFNRFLNEALAKELEESRGALQDSVKVSSLRQKISSEGANFSAKDNRVQALLDTYYKIEDGGGELSDVVKEKSLFHQKLKNTYRLRREVETKLVNEYIEHNKDFTKTVFISETFLEHLSSEYVGEEKRSTTLDAVLLQELDQIFKDYQSKGNP